MNLDEKLDEALKGTFPASDAFYLTPDGAGSLADDEVQPPALGLVENPLCGTAGDSTSFNQQGNGR